MEKRAGFKPKALSVLLAVVMVFGIMPLSTFAAESYKITFNKNTIETDGTALSGTPTEIMPDQSIKFGQAANLNANTYGTCRL